MTIRLEQIGEANAWAWHLEELRQFLLAFDGAAIIEIHARGIALEFSGAGMPRFPNEEALVVVREAVVAAVNQRISAATAELRKLGVDVDGQREASR